MLKSTEERDAFLMTKIMGYKLVYCGGHKNEAGEWKVKPATEGYWVKADSELITQLLKEFNNCPGQFPFTRIGGGDNIIDADGFHPSESWHEWRAVEKTIMQNEKLWRRFVDSFGYEHDYAASIQEYMQADLPARIDALEASYYDLVNEKALEDNLKTL